MMPTLPKVVPVVWLVTVLVGCANPISPEPETPIRDQARLAGTIAYPDWSGQVVSEAQFALSRSRSGTSSKMYLGCYVGDWPYPWAEDCCGALQKVTKYMYGSHPEWRGALGTWNGCQQLGECKFAANLILYRSSYGFPGGHLFLPVGYDYARRGWREAGRGWVIQSPAPRNHTAIVIANGGVYLDVIDSNWVGGMGRYVLARHRLKSDRLNADGYRAYCPWVSPRLVP